MIKNWNLFKESVDEVSKIHEICKKYGIKNYTINDDFSIDLDMVDLEARNLLNIPLKFNRVRHFFDCSFNYLTSLEGCPEYIGLDFKCQENELTSLEGLSKSIGGSIICGNNKIWNFKGIPDSFRGGLICNGNPIWNIYKLFQSPKDIEFLNDCDALREPEKPDGKPIIILERLNFFLETIGKPTIQKVWGYINV
jgi:hypothetical protein